MSSRSLGDIVARLEKYNNSSFPILSIYFHLPVPKLWNNETILNKLEAIINHDLSLKERIKVKRENQYIQGILQTHQQKRGEESIVFFCGGNVLFEVLHLPYKVEDKAIVSHSPFLQPLFASRESYRRFLVILVDREKAIFFTLVQNILEDKGSFFDSSVPQNVHANSSESNNITREDKINRHIQDHLHRHFQKIAKSVIDFIGKRPLTGVIIGGHSNHFEQFEKVLPKSLQERIVGEMQTELNTNMNILLEKSNEIVKKINTELNTQHRPHISSL